MKKLFVFTLTSVLCGAFLLLTRHAPAQNYTHADTLEGHTGTINAIAFNTDGTKLASASEDNTVRIWNTATGQLLHTLIGHTSAVTAVAFSPDGTTLVSGDRDFKTLRFWNPSTGQLLHTWEQFVQAVEDIAWNPDSTRIATAGNFTVRLWNANAHARPDIFRQPTATVTAVAWSPKTGGPVVGGERGTKRMRFWDPATGTLLQTWDQYVHAVEALAFNADGSVLASAGDRTVRLWTPLSHARPIIFPKTHTDTVTSIAWHPDGDTLVSGSLDTEVILWDTDGTVLDTLSGHTGAVHAVAFSAAGTVASAGADTDIRLWTEASVVAHAVTTPQPVVAAESQQAGMPNHYYYQLVPYTPWKYTEGRSLGPMDALSGHTDDVVSVATTAYYPPRDQTYFASGSLDGTVKLWNSHTTTPVATINTGQGKVYDVAFDNRLGLASAVASAGEDGTVKVWEEEDGTLTLQRTLTHATDGSAVYDVFCFDQDGFISAGADGNIRIWKRSFYTPWQLTDAAVTLAHGSPVRVIDGQNPDGYLPWLVSGAEDGSIKVWVFDGEKPEHTRLFRTINNAHTGAVTALMISNDRFTGDYNLVSGGADGMLKRWNLADGSLVTSRDTNGAISDIEIYLDGYTLVVAVDGECRFYYPDDSGDFVYTNTLRTLHGARRVVDIAKHYLGGNPRIITAGGSDQTIGYWYQVYADVDEDRDVDTDDLALVQAAQGTRGHPNDFKGGIPVGDPDVNGDNIVDAADIQLVQDILNGVNAGGTPVPAAPPKTDTAVTDTALLHNYPNPFNPETWIPYQLATAAEVRLSIYAADGRLVRKLALGHQPAGAYLSRSRAGYWDGRNEVGEPVASGVYFYTLKAGDFTATRKMLILK